MVVLVACNYDKEPINSKGARVVTTLLIEFSDAQGQVTPNSVMKSCQNLNLSKLLFSSLLPSRKRKIHPKMKAS